MNSPAPQADFYLDSETEYLSNPNDSSLLMIADCRYVGPFSFYDEFYSGHGRGHPGVSDGYSGVFHSRLVVDDCRKRIDTCDAVFAWIDSEDCYGTLVEIGYAAAKGKKIWIGHPPRPSLIQSQDEAPDQSFKGYDNELWYAFASADLVCEGKTAGQAFSGHTRRQ